MFNHYNPRFLQKRQILVHLFFATKSNCCFLIAFVVFNHRILITGDSNLVRLEVEIDDDPMLQQYNIEYLARPGYRVSFLWANESLFAKQFSHVIIMCGNNDIGVHPRNRYPTQTPLETASRLIAFHNVLAEENVEVAVVGLMFRGDFVDRIDLVLETNGYLKKFLLTDRVKSYVGPRHVQAHDFNRNDPAHLNEQGRRSVRALLLNIIRNKFSL